MTLRITLSVLLIVALVAVLAFFVIRITKLLIHISTNLARVTWGVRTLVTQCGEIGPAADKLNMNLAAAAADLERAAAGAERAGA